MALVEFPSEPDIIPLEFRIACNCGTIASQRYKKQCMPAPHGACIQRHHHGARQAKIDLKGSRLEASFSRDNDTNWYSQDRDCALEGVESNENNKSSWLKA
jgi:hypothetical protein